MSVVKTLRAAGHEAYFAGGCVRDLLLGLTPKDYDVATDAPPGRVRELFRKTQAVGQVFGVILVRMGESVVEVATFRSEGKYLDGRRPSEVMFTTAQEDARRRDFTINGLFMDPLEGDRVIDFVGGQEDLKNRVIRAIGNADERFGEDYLRLLRAVRFAARFGFAIEAKTAEAIGKHAAMLKGISPERIAEELRGMLVGPMRAQAWRMLWRYRLAQVVLRFLDPPPAEGELDERRALIVHLPGERVGFGTALAAALLGALIQATGAEDVRGLLEKKALEKSAHAVDQALKLSNEEFEEMRGTLSGMGPLLGGAEPAVAAMKRFLGRATAGGSRALLEALGKAGLHEQRIGWLKERLDELEKAEVAPEPLVSGDDLVAAGMTPGPVFKRILEGVYDAQLEGRITTKEEGMRMAREIDRG